MTQKLLVMERDTEQGLQDVIKKDILQADNGVRISAISVVQKKVDMTEKNKKIRLDMGFSIPSYFQAWIVVEVPENKDKLYETAMGMTE